ncbi:MAG: mucin-2 protein [Nocardioides sp.]
MANSHKRDTDARRTPRAVLVAGPLAFLATASAVTLGVLANDPPAPHLLATRDATTSLSSVAREGLVSRSDSRRSAAYLKARQAREERRLTREAVAHAHLHRWTTTVLNLWSASGADATRVGELDSGKQVLVTGRTAEGREEVVVDGAARWVTAGYLSADKPVVAPAGLSTAPCPDGSVENGLTSGAVLVYRAVCHAFPQITSYGGWDAHGEHASGKALDIMTSDKALGDQIAAFLQSHASELDLYDVIWWDQIWTPVRASEGWRAYGDHGSATANHMDHVHVSVN